MSEEEKEAIEQLESWREFIIKNKDKVNKANDIEFYLKTVLNLAQKQQIEIEKLKSKNKELLRKLRNRVKEVKKLAKYGLYFKEFAKLNREIEKQDKIIKDYMENELYLNAVIADQDRVINKIAETICETCYNDPDSICSEVDLEGVQTVEDVIQYFKKKAKK